jgi:hypothetical protein
VLKAFLFFHFFPSSFPISFSLHFFSLTNPSFFHSLRPCSSQEILHNFLSFSHQTTRKSQVCKEFCFTTRSVKTKEQVLISLSLFFLFFPLFHFHFFLIFLPSFFYRLALLFKMPDHHTVTPLDLEGVNGYSDNLTAASRFCWRWHHGKRVVTIEDPHGSASESGSGKSGAIRPRDLVGVNGYAHNLEQEYFCWRWMDRDDGDSGGRYRFVTIERGGGGGSPHLGSASITPQQFVVSRSLSRASVFSSSFSEILL